MGNGELDEDRTATDRDATDRNATDRNATDRDATDRNATDRDATDGGVDDRMFDLGGDERRMHVRAYNHWVSLLKGRPYPAIGDLDPASIADFGPHSVLLDFTRGLDDPLIAYLGRALREECGLDATISRIADVPSRSLLSRLTDHYLQIIANRAPIGFEAEFVGTRGRTTLYRGILTPYSSDGAGIDFIYGVINWKEVVDAGTEAALHAELDAAIRAAPDPTLATPIWADGPSAGMREATADEPATLADELSLARESAQAVLNADTRSRSALYAALGRAHDFALAADTDADAYAELLADTGIKAQARAPMTPVVKLVFGTGYDKTRLTEYAAVLHHARRHALDRGALPAFLDAFAGGVKGVVIAERAVRKPVPARKPDTPLADRNALASLVLDTGAAEGDAVVLIARVGSNGTLEIVGVNNDPSLAERVLRSLG